ncbi:MAG: methyltransferase domain-containing protein [Vallitaleaceae bacterium]|jgi:SAM-dependent methyltransferase|nr:methyltransferase domain-containing protein [Vallitaleaceae bacterium]
MSDINWDNMYEYLLNTRGLYYNDDYLKFLVDCVWQISEPVDIIDFGCRYGFLGVKLLPFLPKGSTYTGIDQSLELIEQGRTIFEGTDYKFEFKQSDIDSYVGERNYDIALCHAFMLHVYEPSDVLQIMIDSVKDNGKVICFEPNWIANMSNIYMEGTRQSEIIRLDILQKLYENMMAVNKKDGNIGIKLPVYMSKLGLKDVECRMSDKVNFIDQGMNSSDREKLIESLVQDGLGKVPGIKEVLIENFSALGMTEEEALEQYAAELEFSKRMSHDVWLTYAPSMKISFGKVER